MDFNSKFSKEQEILDSILVFVKLTEDYEINFEENKKIIDYYTYSFQITYCERTLNVRIDHLFNNIMNIECDFSDIIHVGKWGYTQDVSEHVNAYQRKENFYPVLKKIKHLVVNGHRNNKYF